MNQNPAQQPPLPIYVINRENSVWAVASLVFGILGILGMGICGGFVLTVAFGRIALSQIRNSNGTIGGRGAVRNLLITLALAAALFPVDGFAQTQHDPAKLKRLEQHDARMNPPNMLNESESAVERQAVADVGRMSFEELLARRAPELDEPAYRFYEQELRRRPEMKEVPILAADEPRQIAFARNIQPVLMQFGRENYTRLVIFESNNPFVGLYRECLLLVSTKALELMNEEEQRAAAAHELAHESFIGEMRWADAENDNRQRRLIEIECDLTAVIALRRLGDDPLALVGAAEKFALWYRRHPPAANLEPEKSPSPESRKRAIKLFLAEHNFQLAAKAANPAGQKQ